MFAAYNEQLKELHVGNPGCIRNICANHNPRDFGNWFYRRIKAWSHTTPKGSAFVHIFRKTSLQHSRRGEDINRQVANDVRVSESVMMTNYVKETDEEMRQRSNRTYRRIVASLPLDVAQRYGYVKSLRSATEDSLRGACEARDWRRLREIIALLEKEAEADGR